MQEAKQVALYVLVPPASETAEPKVYFGQFIDLAMPLGAHSKEKEFLQRAMMLIWQVQGLT